MLFKLWMHFGGCLSTREARVSLDHLEQPVIACLQCFLCPGGLELNPLKETDLGVAQAYFDP